VTDVDAGPVAEIDHLVTGIAPGVGSAPGVDHRDAVLVTGPWLAGVTSLIAELRARLPGIAFVEPGALSVTEAPVAIVFVVSAQARLTESDCALLDLAAANTDLVIGVVSKIDVHRNWRDVLAADRAALIAHDDRYREVPWVGVAAAPGLGEPKIDKLVERLGHLGDTRLARRNRLRAWETRLLTAMRRCEEECEDADARMAALRDQRRAAVRGRRLAKSERTMALRSQIELARAQLGSFARNRATSVRTELAEDAAALTRRKAGTFEGYARKRVGDVVAEVNGGITDHLRDAAAELHLTAPAAAPPPPPPPLPSPPLRSRNRQTLLMMLLGAAIGVGVALAGSRLFANPAPAYMIGGLVVGAVVGLAVAAWIVAMRGLRHDRAVLDRWVSDVTAELRAAAEHLVSERVLAAETSLTAELAALDAAEAARLTDELAAIDGQMREQGLAAARATARRNRDLPAFAAAIEKVRQELEGSRC
jgi:hypothetical protein